MSCRVTGRGQQPRCVKGSTCHVPVPSPSLGPAWPGDRTRRHSTASPTLHRHPRTQVRDGGWARRRGLGPLVGSACEVTLPGPAGSHLKGALEGARSVTVQEGGSFTRWSRGAPGNGGSGAGARVTSCSRALRDQDADPVGRETQRGFRNLCPWSSQLPGGDRLQMTRAP